MSDDSKVGRCYALERETEMMKDSHALDDTPPLSADPK